MNFMDPSPMVALTLKTCKSSAAEFTNLKNIPASMGLIPSSLLLIIGIGFLLEVRGRVLNDNILIQLKKIDSDVADKLNNIGEMVRKHSIALNS